MTDDDGIESDDAAGAGSSDADRWQVEPEAAPPQRRSRRPIVLGATLVVAAIVAVVVILLGGSDAGSYDDDVRTEFLAACTAGAEASGEDASTVCGCLYDGIVEDIPYERYESVNDALATEREADPDATVALPDDFDAIRVACVDEVGLAPVTTTTTLAAGEEPLVVPPPTTAPPDTAPSDTAASGAGFAS